MAPEMLFTILWESNLLGFSFTATVKTAGSKLSGKKVMYV